MRSTVAGTVFTCAWRSASSFMHQPLRGGTVAAASGSAVLAHVAPELRRLLHSMHLLAGARTWSAESGLLPPGGCAAPHTEPSAPLLTCPPACPPARPVRQGAEFLQMACVALLNMGQSAVVFIGLAMGAPCCACCALLRCAKHSMRRPLARPGPARSPAAALPCPATNALAAHRNRAPPRPSLPPRPPARRQAWWCASAA